MDIQNAINNLVAYALKQGLIEKEDVIYAINSILIDLGIDAADYEAADIEALAKELSSEEIEKGTFLENVPFSLIFFKAS